MSSANLPSTLRIDEHGKDTKEIDDPDLVAEQLQAAAFKPADSSGYKFEKRRDALYTDKDCVVATAEIIESGEKVEITAHDHVGVTPLTPSSSLEIEPKIDWDQIFDVFLEVHRYDRTFDYHGIPLENFLADDKDLKDIYLIVAANYLRSLQPVFRQGLIRSFETKRVDAVDAHGRIDIKRSIWNYKSGVPKQHFITKEPNYNVPVNSLIHLAGKYILSLFQRYAPSDAHQGYYSIFSDVQDKVNYLEEKGISSEFTNLNEYRQITVGMLPSQRFYYRRAIEVSKTILSSATGKPLTGGDEQLTMDYLINMDRLFQEYSQIVLEREIEDLKDQPLVERPDIDILDEPSFSPFEDIDTYIRPDHVLCEDDEYISVLDTKYYSSGEDPTRNLGNRKQMYQYSCILDVDEMVFICPETEPQKRTIERSGKTLQVISPVSFTTEQYEQCVRSYLEEILEIPKTEIRLYNQIQEGHICLDEVDQINDLDEEGFYELLSDDAFSIPVKSKFSRNIQQHIADECSSVDSYTALWRSSIYDVFDNSVCNNIRECISGHPEWATVILPVFVEVEIDDEIEEKLYIYYISKTDGGIEQIDYDTIDTW